MPRRLQTGIPARRALCAGRENQEKADESATLRMATGVKGRTGAEMIGLARTIAPPAREGFARAGVIAAALEISGGAPISASTQFPQKGDPS